MPLRWPSRPRYDDQLGVAGAAVGAGQSPDSAPCNEIRHFAIRGRRRMVANRHIRVHLGCDVFTQSGS